MQVNLLSKALHPTLSQSPTAMADFVKKLSSTVANFARSAGTKRTYRDSTGFKLVNEFVRLLLVRYKFLYLTNATYITRQPTNIKSFTCERSCAPHTYITYGTLNMTNNLALTDCTPPVGPSQRTRRPRSALWLPADGRTLQTSPPFYF